jgi:hypothetical protein
MLRGTFRNMLCRGKFMFNGLHFHLNYQRGITFLVVS